MTVLLHHILLTNSSELNPNNEHMKPALSALSQDALPVSSPVTTPKKSQPSLTRTPAAVPTPGKKIRIRNKAAYVVYEGVVPGIYEKWVSHVISTATAQLTLQQGQLQVFGTKCQRECV